MATKSFSVLTVSKRTGWEIQASKSIGRQTVKPQEWVIITENYPPRGIKSLEYGVDRYIQQAPSKTKLSNLNASLNAGLRHIIQSQHLYSEGIQYVIFYQDFIELQEDCFEKLLELAAPNTWVTTCTPNYDGSDDGRFTGCECPRPCRPEEWEANIAIAPLSHIKACGGFDERLDNGWSWDNVLLAKKAAMMGAKFICDESNRPKLYPHEMSSHETLPKNGSLCERIIRDVREGREPLNCGCL